MRDQRIREPWIFTVSGICPFSLRDNRIEYIEPPPNGSVDVSQPLMMLLIDQSSVSNRRPLVCKSLHGRPSGFTRSHSAMECLAQ
jgi:hypothetical protein